jgi:hypothetical protein
MSVDDVVWVLKENKEVVESYVLIREIKLQLDLEHERFHPELKIKIYKSTLIPDTPFHFEVSHHVHTPEQAAPYYPTRISYGSEREAIQQAIATTTRFLKAALHAGHEPEEAWLVRNDRF